MLYLDYNEKQMHGTKEFPVAFYHVDCAHPRYDMPFHWHKEYEIVRILKGEFRLMLADEELSAHCGDSFFIPGGAIHGGTPENCIYECLVFDLDLLFLHTDICRQYLKKIKHQDIIVHPVIRGEFPSLCHVIDKLFTSMSDRQPGFELAVSGLLLELFGLIFREEFYTASVSGSESPFRHMEQLRPVFEYIENHFASSISLQQLSQISGMSPKYFCRYFQTIVHKTPMDYLNYYRIEHACTLLCTTDSPITSIAYDCGFNDCSYFIKLFKRYKHITPKQYQMQMKR
ncbi:MAG: AraC family transcriptional regulator [Lachnospiraceae bacterium]|nr:AraC family transcriptional regulator [Lachnospiraceae bacterium]MDE7332547.1 AraC family transcriptional regulator [Lachnospiraceae bacterium]